jgi:hypothetical protein
MRRTHLSLAIATAALVGCSDSPSTTQIATAERTAFSPRDTTVSGTVIPNTDGHKGATLVLLTADGTTIGLSGDQAAALNAVINAQVEVDGLLDEAAEIAVKRFVVLAVGGEPVSDGVLDLMDGSFVLHLTKGGDRPVLDPSAELQQNLGARIWIAGPDDGSPTAFGIITPATGEAASLARAARHR